METVTVAVIVGIAVVYIAKFFYAGTKKGGTCGCGCTSCSASGDCGEKKT
ncbi:MAG: FeoB-associated Cys-rich membrane protein [Desulfobacterales bacterium]